jgi:hypothetical protein
MAGYTTTLKLTTNQHLPTNKKAINPDTGELAD